MINDQIKIYKDLFYKRDESLNKEQRFDVLLAMDHFRVNVEDELRQDVDRIIREELIYLKLSIDNVDDSTQKKKTKKKSKKNKRKNKNKDLVANRSDEKRKKV